MIVDKPINREKAMKKLDFTIDEKVDAIVKCIKHMQSNGVDVGPDIQAIIEHRDTVKRKNPKPNKA